MKPKISFIIPSFNCAAWLPHAVKSCQMQTIKDIEIVIVNDFSTDSTNEYLSWLYKQDDKRIKIINNHKNLGRSESRNIGNRTATGDIICVLDSDDLAMENRAELTLKKMKTCQVCHGSAVMMDALGNSIREQIANPIELEKCLKEKVTRIVHSTMAYTKDIAIKYPYETGAIANLGIDDWAQQMKMLIDGVKFGYIPDVVSAYRMLGNSVTNTRDPKLVEAEKNNILEGFKCKA